jgi:hypothetical protein
MAGCSLINAFEDPPVVGSWSGRVDERNELEVDLLGEGSATLHYSLVNDPTGYIDRFDLDWEQTDIEEYALSMRCVESTHPQGCDDNDPELSCDAASDGSELDCTTDHPLWQSYDMNWDEDG